MGLSEYADRFTENRVDLSILPDLTDEDLKELGVLLGDRRRILRGLPSLLDPSPSPNSRLLPEPCRGRKPNVARSR